MQGANRSGYEAKLYILILGEAALLILGFRESVRKHRIRGEYAETDKC